MTAVLLRLCDEDRERFGGPEWVRFDPVKLDDIPWPAQHEWETEGLDMAINWLLLVDWPARTARGKAAVVWLARTMDGIETPTLRKFDIKTTPNKLTIREDQLEGGDADPPDVSPSSEVEASGTDSL